jgi:hypothetical protein
LKTLSASLKANTKPQCNHSLHVSSIRY